MATATVSPAPESVAQFAAFVLIEPAVRQHVLDLIEEPAHVTGQPSPPLAVFPTLAREILSNSRTRKECPLRFDYWATLQESTPCIRVVSTWNCMGLGTWWNRWESMVEPKNPTMDGDFFSKSSKS